MTERAKDELLKGQAKAADTALFDEENRQGAQAKQTEVGQPDFMNYVVTIQQDPDFLKRRKELNDYSGGGLKIPLDLEIWPEQLANKAMLLNERYKEYPEEAHMLDEVYKYFNQDARSTVLYLYAKGPLKRLLPEQTLLFKEHFYRTWPTCCLRATGRDLRLL